jgi:hypothetical protein
MMDEQKRLALALERIDLLADAVRTLRAEVARLEAARAEAQADRDALRAALTEIAGVLLQRHQEGWEERLYQIARKALEGKE